MQLSEQDLTQRQVLFLCVDNSAGDYGDPAGRAREDELPNFVFDTQSMHDLYGYQKHLYRNRRGTRFLVRERKNPKESFPRIIRRVLSERPALTAGDLLEAMKALEAAAPDRGAAGRALLLDTSQSSARMSWLIEGWDRHTACWAHVAGRQRRSAS